MAKFIAASKEDLAAGGSQKLGEALIHGDAEVASRMAAVGNLILLQDGTKWHAAF